MITELAEWYRPLSIQTLSEEILKKRAAEIKKIVKTKDTFWLLECIRFYFGKPTMNGNFQQELVSMFLKSDQMFPQRDNLRELQLLSGAIISEYILGGKDGSISVALAFQTALFGVDQSILQCQEIIEKIKKYIDSEGSHHYSIENEQEEFPEINLEADLTANTPEVLNTKIMEINNLFLRMQKQIDHLNNEMSFLKEESNIHWWLFRNKGIKKRKTDNDDSLLPLLIGSELCELVNLLPGPLASIEFLKKALYDAEVSTDTQISIEVIIKNISRDFIDKLIENVETHISNITPLHLSFLKSKELEDDAWKKPFVNATNLLSSSNISVLEIAKQMYYEKLFISSVI